MRRKAGCCEGVAARVRVSRDHGLIDNINKKVMHSCCCFCVFAKQMYVAQTVYIISIYIIIVTSKIKKRCEKIPCCRSKLHCVTVTFPAISTIRSSGLLIETLLGSVFCLSGRKLRRQSQVLTRKQPPWRSRFSRRVSLWSRVE